MRFVIVLINEHDDDDDDDDDDESSYNLQAIIKYVSNSKLVTIDVTTKTHHNYAYITELSAIMRVKRINI